MMTILNTIAGIINNIVTWFIGPIKTIVDAVIVAQQASLGILTPIAI